jgi:phosphatidate phosphatase APP1
MRAVLAAAALAAALRAPSAGADDAPLLLAPPSLARPDRAWIAGRVVEERHDRGPGPVRTARRLAAENWEGAPVEVRFLGRTARARSGHDGGFAVEIAAAPGAPFPAGLHLAVVSVPGATARARVHVVPPEAPFLVVSDLDDTLAVTNVASVRGVLSSVFLEDAETQPAAPGMAAFLRCLAEGRPVPPPFAIVSGSPVQLAPRVDRFLEKNRFPPAALYLRNLGPRTLSGYKEPVLAELLSRFAQPVVLVGDSGERDPEIYAALARANPGRVLRIYVRAAGDPGPRERFEGMALFSEAAAAAADAAGRGLADAACVARELPEARP